MLCFVRLSATTQAQRFTHSISVVAAYVPLRRTTHLLPCTSSSITMTTAETQRRASSRIANRATVAPPVAAAPAVESKKRTAPSASAGVQTAATKAEVPKADAKKAKNDHAPASAARTSGATAGPLKVGDALPAITLQDESGKSIDVSALSKSVIFTYPKANTPGCTTQACLFRDEYTGFQKAGFAVYGLSNDGLTSLRNWKEKKNFPYALLSDPKRDLIGVLTGSKSSTQRSHFVIDGSGKLALSSLGVKPAESSPATLKFTQSL